MTQDDLLQALRQHGRGFRLRRAQRAAVSGALWGAGLAVVCVLAAKVVGLSLAETAAGLGVALVLPLGAFALAWVRPVPAMQVARALDREHALHERTATALEWMTERRAQTLMSRAQFGDALKAVQAVPPRTAFPLQWPKRLWWAPSLLLMCGVLMWLPPFTLFSDMTNEERRTLQAQAQKLDALAQELVKVQPQRPDAPRLDKLSAELKQLARDLQSPRVSKREALARIAAQQQEVRRAMQQAAQAPGGGGPGRPNNTRTPGSARAEAQAAAARLQAMAEALKSASSMSPDQKRQLAEALKKMAQSARSDAARQALQKAARDMQAGQSKAAAEAMQQAARDMEAAAADPSQQALERVAGSLSDAQQQLAGNSQGQQQMASSDGSQEIEMNGGDFKSGQGGQYQESGERKPGDFGRGSTNQEHKNGQKAPDYVIQRQRAGSKSDLTDAYKRLYVPEKTKVTLQNARVSGTAGTGAIMPTGQEVRGAPRMGDSSTVPEQDVYNAYRRSAEEAIVREEVPDEHRDLVRGYFEEIKPR